MMLGGGGDACVPWDKGAFCAQKQSDCGPTVGPDNCGTFRNENCGTCYCPDVCDSNKCIAKTGFLVGAACQCKENCNALDNRLIEVAQSAVSLEAVSAAAALEIVARVLGDPDAALLGATPRPKTGKHGTELLPAFAPR